MKTRQSSIMGLLLVGFILGYSCGKESPTVVNGTMLDKYTEEPLQGVYIFIEKWEEKKGGYFHYTTIQTDQQGRFSFGDDDTPDFQIGQMRKSGYLYKHQAMDELFNSFEKGKINEGEIRMLPFDGVLSLKVENVTGLHDTIFLAIFSPLLNSEIGISQGKVSLPNPTLIITPGQDFSQNILLASNQIVDIHWDFKPVVFSTSFKAPSTISRNDTVFYTISY